MTPFRPFPDKPNVMSYYEVPINVLENRNLLQDWAQKALNVARTKKSRSKN